jgi:predicted enzyme related to lactoylglutathione lyase
MPRIVHFEIPADNPGRAVEFYKKVFEWKIEKWQGPMDYWLATTGKEGELGINGAIMDRSGPKSPVNTIAIVSLEDYIRRVSAAGGKQVTPTQTIPGIGLFCYCTDTEGNWFGLLQPAAEMGAPQTTA